MKLWSKGWRAREIGKTYTPDHSLVSDARLAVEAITEALEQRVGAVERASVDGREWEARKIPHLPGKIHPGRLAQMIGRMLPDNAVLLADAGAHLAWLGYYVELEKGQNFRKTGAFGPMSAHVNGAIGVKLAHPGRTVGASGRCSRSDFDKHWARQRTSEGDA